jgi:hypothetical protein
MKAIILNTLALLSLLAAPPLLISDSASAACTRNPNSSSDYVLNGVGEAGGPCSGEGVNNVLKTIVNILSFIVGVAAIIVIILSGFRYITSGGDSNKVGAAKNALIYALVGLVIAALAQLLVQLVLNRASNP